MGIIDKLFGGKSLEQRFWKWFSMNSVRLYTASTGQEEVCGELEEELHKVHKDLTYVFGPIINERREFIISADGMLSVFPAVQRLAAAAPDLPGWRIRAFRPPAEPDAVRVGSCFLHPGQVHFSAEPSGGRLDLALFIRDMEKYDEQSLSSAVFLLLDAVLGEYDAEMKLSKIECKPLPEGPVRSKLLSLEHLPETARRLLSEA